MSILCLPIAIALGAACGLLYVFALRRQSIKLGGIAIIASFFGISAGIYAVRSLAPELAVPASVLIVLSFLAVVVVAGIRMRD